MGRHKKSVQPKARFRRAHPLPDAQVYFPDAVGAKGPFSTGFLCLMVGTDQPGRLKKKKKKIK